MVPATDGRMPIIEPDLVQKPGEELFCNKCMMIEDKIDCFDLRINLQKD